MSLFSQPVSNLEVTAENFLQKRLDVAAEIASTISQININKIKVNCCPLIYRSMLHNQTTETRLEHIMKHFNVEQDGNLSVRSVLVEHFNLTFEDLDSDTKHEKVLFDFIEELTSGEFQDETIVYRRFQPETQDHTKKITFWHLPTNIVIHTYLSEKHCELNITSCYVRNSEILNCEEMSTGKCAFTGMPLNMVSLIPTWFYEMMFPEPVVIKKVVITEKAKAVTPTRALPKFLTLSKAAFTVNNKTAREKTLVCA
jgi:hypothetical protein